MNMNKLLEVREFDTIIGNENYEGYQGYKYIGNDNFNGLIDFIHKFAGDNDSSDVLDFMKIGYKRNIGNTVNIKNYVGLIQIDNGFQLQVLPKIDFGVSDSNNLLTKKIFIKMLRSMKDFPAKVFSDASIKIDNMNLYDIFINMYLQEVRILVKKGISSSYVELEENIKYCKGKLVINKHISNNLLHKERFYVSYDEFYVDTPQNRIIKATLEKLSKITNSYKNSKEIRQLLMSFEFVKASVNYESDFSKIVISRNTRIYENLIKWSKVFLLNKSFTAFSGLTSSISLLFSMDSVYESYVSQQIKKILTPYGWVVSCQDKGYYLFEKPKKQFALRPDIVLKKNNRTIIMDTKWKRLYNKERSNYGISQVDMYQMYAYSKKYGTQDIWLLYPVNDEFRNREMISFFSGDGTYVNVFFVDVANIENSIKLLRSKIEID